ncbi:MAG: hypothetical protein JOY78_15760 [Pseudonocardia sp.]|nr:hypothetical protein [Pseudonocardia sp.]
MNEYVPAPVYEQLTLVAVGTQFDGSAAAGVAPRALTATAAATAKTGAERRRASAA